MILIEQIIDITKALLPFGSLIKFVPIWVRYLFGITACLLATSMIVAWYYRDNKNVYINPRSLRFTPGMNMRHQKSLEVVNNLEVPVYNLRVFAMISGATGKDFFDAELVRDPLKPARGNKPDSRDTIFVFSVIYEKKEGLLIVIPRLKAKKKLNLVVSCDKVAKLRFDLLEWQHEDPGVQLSSGGSVDVDFIRPAALSKKDFIVNGMRVILMQPD